MKFGGTRRLLGINTCERKRRGSRIVQWERSSCNTVLTKQWSQYCWSVVLSWAEMASLSVRPQAIRQPLGRVGHGARQLSAAEADPEGADSQDSLLTVYFLALGSKAFLGGVVLEACSLPLMATPDCQRVGGMWSRCLRRGRAKCGGIWQPDKISARSPNQLSKGACAWELPDKSRQYDLHLAAGLPHLLGP